MYAVPKFIGPDLNEYGPFQKGDNAEVPHEIAEILINKGRLNKLVCRVMTLYIHKIIS